MGQRWLRSSAVMPLVTLCVRLLLRLGKCACPQSCGGAEGSTEACKILKECTKYLLAKKAVHSKILLDCLAFRGCSVNKVA